MRSGDRRRRRVVVLHCDDVVDDETLHPGSVVWLGRQRLRPDELRRHGLQPHVGLRQPDPDGESR